MRTLSIDYGDKRIGLAVSDPLGITAQGLPTLKNESIAKSIERIAEICIDQSVGTIVVGLPLNFSGEMGSRAQLVMKWKEKLSQHVKCDVVTWDERLSSKEVTRLMIAQDLSRKKQKEKCDELSAIIILQGYLECQRNTNPK